MKIPFSLLHSSLLLLASAAVVEGGESTVFQLNYYIQFLSEKGVDLLGVASGAECAAYIESFPEQNDALINDLNSFYTEFMKYYPFISKSIQDFILFDVKTVVRDFFGLSSIRPCIGPIDNVLCLMSREDIIPILWESWAQSADFDREEECKRTEKFLEIVSEEYVEELKHALPAAIKCELGMDLAFKCSSPAECIRYLGNLTALEVIHSFRMTKIEVGSSDRSMSLKKYVEKIFTLLPWISTNRETIIEIKSNHERIEKYLCKFEKLLSFFESWDWRNKDGKDFCLKSMISLFDGKIPSLQRFDNVRILSSLNLEMAQTSPKSSLSIESMIKERQMLSLEEFKEIVEPIMVAIEYSANLTGQSDILSKKINCASVECGISLMASLEKETLPGISLCRYPSTWEEIDSSLSTKNFTISSARNWQHRKNEQFRRFLFTIYDDDMDLVARHLHLFPHQGSQAYIEGIEETFVERMKIQNQWPHATGNIPQLFLVNLISKMEFEKCSSCKKTYPTITTLKSSQEALIDGDKDTFFQLILPLLTARNNEENDSTDHDIETISSIQAKIKPDLIEKPQLLFNLLLYIESIDFRCQCAKSIYTLQLINDEPVAAMQDEVLNPVHLQLYSSFMPFGQVFSKEEMIAQIKYITETEVFEWKPLLPFKLQKLYFLDSYTITDFINTFSNLDTSIPILESIEEINEFVNVNNIDAESVEKLLKTRQEERERFILDICLFDFECMEEFELLFP